ncbi:MAG TPA: NADH-quinone oxidoreductase subunit N [Gemmatimonadaceae bacterium]|nr:NADH-quinone oxidoreductase subunit N [Gemmatimonadaceae bacterium]
MKTLDLTIPSQLMTALAPDITLMVGAMALLLWAAWGRESIRRQRAVGVASMILCGIVAAMVVFFMRQDVGVGPGPIALDGFRWTADLVLLLATFATIALSMDYNERERITAAESHVLLLLATSGMMVLVSARDLIIVFLGIEIMSVAVYVLAGMNRRSDRAAEGALKYFLLGAFSTCFLLYGIALVYGATGSTNLTTIAERIGGTGPISPLLLIGMALLVVGFGFKIAAVPFHMWAPDVYEGAPTPVTAYMAAAVKAAAFASFLRVWMEAFPYVFAQWHHGIWWLAAVTMVAGNLIALSQKNIKRMLAYSSIAHAGYILVAVLARGNIGSSAFLFYLFAYTLATFGAFAVVVVLSGRGDRYLKIEDYAGLWTVRPWLAGSMAVFMLALLGFPIFGGIGFFAKWYLLQAALDSITPLTNLSIILVLTSVVSAGYYLYVVMVMFMKPVSRTDSEPQPSGRLTQWVIAAAAVLILAFGIFPDPVARLARSSVIVPIDR